MNTQHYWQAFREGYHSTESRNPYIFYPHGFGESVALAAAWTKGRDEQINQNCK
jgi:hypothetical protein